MSIATKCLTLHSISWQTQLANGMPPHPTCASHAASSRLGQSPPSPFRAAHACTTPATLSRTAGGAIQPPPPPSSMIAFGGSYGVAGCGDGGANAPSDTLMDPLIAKASKAVPRSGPPQTRRHSVVPPFAMTSWTHWASWSHRMSRAPAHISASCQLRIPLELRVLRPLIKMETAPMSLEKTAVQCVVCRRAAGCCCSGLSVLIRAGVYPPQHGRYIAVG